MFIGQELKSAISLRHPDAFCLGSICYIRLDNGNLAKVNFTSRGGYYNGLQLEILNRRTGPVDSITLHSWDVPRKAKEEASRGEKTAWDIHRPALDADALWELAEEYLRLFQDCDSERG